MKQYSKYQLLPCPLCQEELDLFPQILSKLGALPKAPLGSRNLACSSRICTLFLGMLMSGQDDTSRGILPCSSSPCPALGKHPRSFVIQNPATRPHRTNGPT